MPDRGSDSKRTAAIRAVELVQLPFSLLTMDCFSVAAAAVGLVGDVVRLVTYVREVKNAIGTIDGDIDGLIGELEALEKVQKQLGDECNHQTHQSPGARRQQNLWAYADNTLQLVGVCIDKFRTELQAIYGTNPKHQSLKEAYIRSRRLKNKQSKFQGWRKEIAQHSGILQTLLQMITCINQSVKTPSKLSAH